MKHRASHTASPPGNAERRPHLGVDDILRAHGEAFRRNRALAPVQLGVMRAIVACRTAELGGHLDVCLDCGHKRPSYNSCGNRHCPKCQSLAQDEWIESRKPRILPVHYFHGVFTLPHQLNALALRNAELVYDLLFASASDALLAVAADPAHLGALPAVTMVLHTWTRDLRYHIHLHAIVSGGGLSPDGDRWIATARTYLLPNDVLSPVLRGKFLDGLRKAWDQGRLNFGGGCADLARPRAFKRFLSKLYEIHWLVYDKPSFGGAEQVVEYLGRYTHRTGISNQRLLSMDEEGVRFRTRDDQVATLAPHEFLRRFLLHVLPKGLKKIRHYGLLAPGNVRTRLPAARLALGVLVPPPEPRRIDWCERLLRLTGVDPTLCPACGARLVRRPFRGVGICAVEAGDVAPVLPRREDSS